MPHTLPRKTHIHTHRFLYHVHEVSVGKYLMRLHCVWTGRLKAISVDVCRQRRPSSASSELIKVQYTIRKHCASLCRLFTHTTNHTHTHTISLSRKQTSKNPERLKQRQNQLRCLRFLSRDAVGRSTLSTTEPNFYFVLFVTERSYLRGIAAGGVLAVRLVAALLWSQKEQLLLALRGKN